jgi:nucleotide-binding universal stress UspA family protein
MEARNILVPVSGHPSDAEAIEVASNLARSCKGKVHVLYVIEVPRSRPVDCELSSEDINKGEDVLRVMEKRAKDCKCNVVGDLVQVRKAGPAVVEEAIQTGADTIVVSMPFRPQFGVADLGNAVPYVLRNAPCQVIVLREPAPTANGTLDW